MKFSVNANFKDIVTKVNAFSDDEIIMEFSSQSPKGKEGVYLGRVTASSSVQKASMVFEYASNGTPTAATCIMGKDFEKAISALSLADSESAFVFEKQPEELVIQKGKAQLKVPVKAASTSSSIPAPAKTDMIVCTAKREELKKALKTVLAATIDAFCDSKTQDFADVIRFIPGENKIRLFGANGYVISVADVKTAVPEKVAEAWKSIAGNYYPVKKDHLISALDSFKEDVRLYFCPAAKQLIFADGTTNYTFKLLNDTLKLDAPVEMYNRFKDEAKITVSTKELKNAVNVATVLQNEKAARVQLRTTANEGKGFAVICNPKDETQGMGFVGKVTDGFKGFAGYYCKDYILSVVNASDGEITMYQGDLSEENKFLFAITESAFTFICCVNPEKTEEKKDAEEVA